VSAELKELLAALTRLINLGAMALQIMLDEHSVENGETPRYGTVPDPNAGTDERNPQARTAARAHAARRPGRRMV
jgi:hypothetical protein